MSVVLGCPCGRQLELADGAASIRCPVCGRVLSPRAATGLRTLWPRLVLAAAATLLGVIAAGFVLVRYLPRANPELQRSPASDRPALVTEADERKILPAAPASDTLPRLDPTSQKASSPILPLLDQPTPPLLSGDLPKFRPGDKPSSKPLAVENKGVIGPKIGDEFFQELLISRQSRYRILETDLAQNAQYGFVSRFRIKSKDASGMMVEQKIESVRLSNADPALQTRLNELLERMKGATFTITLNARREVTKFEGASEAIEVFNDKNPLGGSSFLLWSFLDRDGWKELAQLSFFQPPESIVRGDKWEQPLTHSWGPLGAWKGKTHYQFTARQLDRDRFDYLLDLSYKPPGKSSGLPFEIGQSEFVIRTARGAIVYSRQLKRVAAAEEIFHVRGALAISCLGTETIVHMDEMQRFQLRILDRNPLAK